METAQPDEAHNTETLQLRFVGEDIDGNDLHELRAAHVAEVLQGIVELASDFDKSGAFGDGPPTEVLVRPPTEGSFTIEVIKLLHEHGGTFVTATGVSTPPTMSSVFWWATKSMRADVKDFGYLDNGNVKVVWQDDTVDEIPVAAWQELNKRKRRRKKQLRRIMAPLSDEKVTALQVSDETVLAAKAEAATPDSFTLERLDYHAAKPEDEIEESRNIFEIEAQMSAIDFEDPEKWRVKAKDRSARLATLEDTAFLGRVDQGLAIHKRDIFRLKIREDLVKKNGRSRRKWTVLQVLDHRRSVGDDDT
ncbi:MAG: hypothetical protein ABIR57_15685 [Aeromicrobium sp.]